MNTFTPSILQQMREWIAECSWPDLDPDAVATLSDEQVVRGVRRHFDGGVQAFVQTCEMEAA